MSTSYDDLSFLKHSFQFVYHNVITKCTKQSYWCEWKIRVDLIDVGCTNFLVKVELTQVQDPSLPLSFHEDFDQQIKY